MRRHLVICIAAVAFFELVYEPAILPATAEPATDKNCTDCHPDYVERLSDKYNHPPFANGDCMSCHQYHGFRNENELSGTIIDICTACHTEIMELPEEMIHYPVAEERSCLACHSPHSANNKKFLNNSEEAICLECHESPEEAAGTIHRPYADSACVVCHNPHGSLFSSSLNLPTGYVCLTCHESLIPENNPAEMHAGEDIASCEHCHHGHSAISESLLHANIDSLCAGCHTSVREALDGGEPHSAILEEDCLACHMPHFPKGAGSLVETSPDLCFSCHDEIREQLDFEFVHAPAADDCATCHDSHVQSNPEEERELCVQCHDIEESDFLAAHALLVPSACSDCHAPHGSETAGLIRAVEHPPFADRECQACHEPGRDQLDLQNSELCLKCHDDLEPSSAHPVQQLAEQTCIACHSPHAGNNEYLIRPTRAGHEKQ